MTRVLGALALLAGCHQVFGLEYVDAMVDAGPDAPPCPMPVVSDDFASGSPCSDWGFPFSNATLAGGDLVLAPSPTGADNAGCVSQIPFPFGDTGIFIAVDEVGTGDAQYNTLILFWDTGNTVSTKIQIAKGRISMADRTGTELGAAMYDPIAMRWMRLRPSFDRSGIVGETSPDGIGWTELGHEVRAAPPTIRAQLQSGTIAATNATAMRVASFDVCP